MFWKPLSQSLVTYLHVDDGPQNSAKDGVRTARMGTVLIAAVVTVFIAALEALAKIVVVVGLGHIITNIAVVRVPIGITASAFVAPAVYWRKRIESSMTRKVWL